VGFCLLMKRRRAGKDGATGAWLSFPWPVLQPPWPPLLQPHRCPPWLSAQRCRPPEQLLEQVPALAWAGTSSSKPRTPRREGKRFRPPFSPCWVSCAGTGGTSCLCLQPHQCRNHLCQCRRECRSAAVHHPGSVRALRYRRRC
jgi:hypothetical protein